MRKFLAKVLVIVAIVLLVVAAMWSYGLLSEGMIATMSQFFAGIGIAEITIGGLVLLGAISLGLALVVDKEAALDVINSVVDAVSDTAEVITDGLVSIVEGALDSVMGSKWVKWIAIGAVGFLGYKLLKDNKNDKNSEVVVRTESI